MRTSEKEVKQIRNTRASSPGMTRRIAGHSINLNRCHPERPHCAASRHCAGGTPARAPVRTRSINWALKKTWASSTASDINRRHARDTKFSSKIETKPFCPHTPMRPVVIPLLHHGWKKRKRSQSVRQLLPRRQQASCRRARPRARAADNAACNAVKTAIRPIPWPSSEGPLSPAISNSEIIAAPASPSSPAARPRPIGAIGPGLRHVAIG